MKKKKNTFNNAKCAGTNSVMFFRQYQCVFVYGDIVFSGDITQRMCTAGEIEAYARSFAGGSGKAKGNLLKPNLNCNLSTWLNGCEPGWGCKANMKIDLNSKKKEIPARSVDCQPCCEGFFCPRGITCMIRKHIYISLFNTTIFNHDSKLRLQSRS